MSQHHNDLIRRLRNAAPPAIKGPNLLDEAADRIRVLESALLKYAEHKPDCASGNIVSKGTLYNKYCGCGLSAVAQQSACSDLRRDAVKEITTLRAELALLSDKACASVYRYRQALESLTDSWKYSTEVVTIAREALAKPETNSRNQADQVPPLEATSDRTSPTPRGTLPNSLGATPTGDSVKEGK